MTETNDDFSKYDILENVVKTTRDKDVTIDQIEKQLRKIKARTNQNGTYSEIACKAVVDHFKLVKQLGKSDKARIAFLVKENRQLKASLPRVEKIAKNINEINKKITYLSQKIDQLSNTSSQNNSNENDDGYVQDQLPLDDSNSDDDSRN